MEWKSESSLRGLVSGPVVQSEPCSTQLLLDMQESLEGLALIQGKILECIFKAEDINWLFKYLF